MYACSELTVAVILPHLMKKKKLSTFFVQKNTQLGKTTNRGPKLLRGIYFGKDYEIPNS
jgi:hypothetical protein